jgi:uncharacterized protein YjiS (DUF1127 family)
MSQILEKISSWLNRQERMRRTRKELSLLTDRDLADIGINRCDINRIAHQEPVNVAI